MSVLFVSDLDGTLLDEQRSLVAVATSVIGANRDHGVAQHLTRVAG